jgi:hypothetical protein
MNLTKKQKKYIKSNYPKLSVEEISKRYNLKIEDVENYLKSIKIFKKPSPKKEYLKKWSKKLDLYLGILIFLSSVFIGIYCFDTKLNITGDNITYMDLGTSIAEGRGLAGQTQYPFGFPLLLAIAQILFNKSILAQIILVLLTYIFSSLFLFFIFKKYIGAIWSFIVCFLSISNPIIIEHSHYVMSDVPFLCFSFIAIYLFIKYKDMPLNSWQFYGAIIAVVWVYYIRSNGFVLIGAVWLSYFLKKNWKKGLVTSGCFFVLMFPWILRGMLLSKGLKGSGYLDMVLYKDTYHPELGRLDFPSLLGRIFSNLKLYLLVELPNGVLPYYFNTGLVKGLILPYFIGIILFGIFLAGLIWAFKNRQYVLSLYVIFFLGVLILWPAYGRGERHFLPILPLSIYFGAYFFYKLYKVLLNKINVKLIYGILWVMAFLLLFLSLKNIKTFADIGRNYPPEWVNYFKAAEWARDNTPENSIIIDRKSELFKTVSKRVCVGFLSTPDSKALIEHLYKVKADYVVVSSIPFGSIEAYLVPAVNKYIEKFKVVFFIDNPRTFIFKFDRTGEMP